MTDRSSDGGVPPFFHLPGDLTSLCQEGFSGGPVIKKSGQEEFKDMFLPVDWEQAGDLMRNSWASEEDSGSLGDTALFPR